MEEKINPDKAILAGLDAAVFSKEETCYGVYPGGAKALLETAGGTAVGTLLQSRPHRILTRSWARARWRSCGRRLRPPAPIW